MPERVTYDGIADRYAAEGDANPQNAFYERPAEQLDVAPDSASDLALCPLSCATSATGPPCPPRRLGLSQKRS
jgi:hypothetical protein